MKSENTILEELSFPSNYLSSMKDVTAFVERAFNDGVYFKNKVYATVQGNQMLFVLDGISFPLMSKEAVVDARVRLIGDELETISDPLAIKRLIQGFDDKTKALYWWLLVKYAEATILKTQAATTIYAVLGENGVVDNVYAPPPSYIQDFEESCDDDEDDECCDDEDDDEYI